MQTKEDLVNLVETSSNGVEQPRDIFPWDKRSEGIRKDHERWSGSTCDVLGEYAWS